jgi:hypothetical protein
LVCGLIHGGMRVARVVWGVKRVSMMWHRRHTPGAEAPSSFFPWRGPRLKPWGTQMQGQMQ